MGGLIRRTPLQRRTALTARTPLIARVPLLRRTELARRAERRADPALPVSGLRSRMGDPIPLSVRREVRKRSEGMCEACGMSGADHLHHRRLRSQGGQHTAVNLLHVHWGCHEDIHQNRTRSEALGHIVPGWADPADVPVQLLPKIRSL